MSPHSFFLTRRAAMDMKDIHAYSVSRWGERTAKIYIDKIYEVMRQIAERPDQGGPRRDRSVPFQIVPAGRHFVVYDILNKDVIILTVLHQRRNIEQIIAEFTPVFIQEIMALRDKTRP